MKDFKNFQLNETQQRNAIGKGRPWGDGSKDEWLAENTGKPEGTGKPDGVGAPWDVAGVTKDEWLDARPEDGE